MSAEWDNSSAEPDPTLRPERLAEDGDKALRPKGLNEFIGQEAARANLSVDLYRCSGTSCVDKVDDVCKGMWNVISGP